MKKILTISILLISVLSPYICLADDYSDQMELLHQYEQQQALDRIADALEGIKQQPPIIIVVPQRDPTICRNIYLPNCGEY